MLAVVTDYSAEKTQMIKILLMPNIAMRIDMTAITWRKNVAWEL